MNFSYLLWFKINTKGLWTQQRSPEQQKLRFVISSGKFYIKKKNSSIQKTLNWTFISCKHKNYFLFNVIFPCYVVESCHLVKVIWKAINKYVWNVTDRHGRKNQIVTYHSTTCWLLNEKKNRRGVYTCITSKRPYW